MDLKKGFYQFVAKILVWIMMVQGIPFWQLSRTYQYNFHPEKLANVLELLTDALLLPGSAHAGVAPGADDYTANRIPGNFFDISGTGTELALADEDGLAGIPLGFNFTFYSEIMTAVAITSNGYISFSPTISPHNQLIPTASTPNGVIAPFWDDIDPSLNPASGIFYRQQGTAPDRKFIVQFQDVPLKADPDSRLTFQVVLFEQDNEIQFHYLSMVDGSGLAISPLVTGQSATIGLESNNGERGVEVGYNKVDIVTSGSALSFTLEGTAFDTGRLLADLNNDGFVDVQDQYRLTQTMVEETQERRSLDLVLADISPAPGPLGDHFGDQLIDSGDHERLFEAVMNREDLNPTLKISSFYIAAASETLTLFGSGFAPVAADNMVTFVSVDGTELSFAGESVTDASRLTITVPGTLDHTASLRVDQGSLMSNALAFYLQGVPVISSITPDNGEEGDSITIRGYEFGATAGENIVLFDGTAAVVDSVTDTEGMDTLVVTIPSGASSGPLTVTVDTQTSNEIAFIYDGAPVVAITAPEDNTEVSGSINVTGTASDLGLTSYILEMGQYDSDTPADYSVIASGTENVTDGVLATVDATLMHNGFYKLRLTAEDTSGKVSSIEREFIVSGANKAGTFSMEFTDLTVPVQGIPITVKRKYDTRDRSYEKDFGYGWTVEVGAEGTYSNNRKPGIGWSFSSSGGFVPIPCSVANEHESHVTEIRFSDTEFYRFAFVPGNVPAFSSICSGNAYYEQIGGTPGATLEIIGDNSWIYNGGELVDWDFNTFEPDRVRLTTRDGRQYALHIRNGVESISDSNGNSLSISDSGVVHSSGRSVSFTRDGQDRITAVTDPAGNSLAYAYDGNGDLSTFTDRAGNTTSFEYSAVHAHLLENIIDPENNAVVRNEYDESGRLVAKVDADGNRVEIDIDTESNQTTVTDREGQITIVQYDDQGNITDSGSGLTYTYDDAGNRTSATDALGNTRTFTWDTSAGRNDLISETDALGNTISYTWDASGHPLTATDASGNVTTNTYDSAGNLISITDGNGVVTNVFDYDSNGNMTQITTLGGTWDMTYDAHGNATRIQGPTGQDIRFTHDANGNPLTKTITRTTDTGPVDETTTMAYDGNGRVTSITDPLGYVTQLTYNGNGRIISRTDALGNTISYEYDKRGNLIKANFPDGTNELMGYDREDRMTGITDRSGNTTLYEYDGKDRIIRTIFADGSTTSTEYDAADRISQFTNHNNKLFTFVYDAVGNLSSLTDPLGNATEFTYHPTRARATQTDPLGRTTSYAYDESAFNTPRLNKTTFADGTIVTQTYASSGKIASRTDELGNVTSFEYDNSGNLFKVTDAMGGVTNYLYDEVGNRISQTDPNGNTTLFAYDANRNLIKRTLPLGQVETFTYDAAGNMISHTNFNGETITCEYDAMGRMTRRVLPGTDEEIYTYTGTGKVDTITHANLLTTFDRVSDYDYDARDRIVSVTHSLINSAGTTVDFAFIRYTWDAEGNRTSVETPSGTTDYTYDALNRLATVTDPDDLETQYTYNDAGNLTEIALPNGTETQYAYDARNRPVSVSHLNGGIIGQYDYILDAVGRRVRMADSFGRTVDYEYDALGRLIKEDEGVPVIYTYDAAGNRLTRGGEFFTYDANNRMLTADSGTTTFTYDDNGNRIRKMTGSDTTDYAYDALNRLTGHIAPDSTVSVFEYDTFGNRILKNFGGTSTRYLVDTKDNSGYAQVVEKRSGTGLTASFIHGNDLIKMDRSGVPSYFHQDGLGSTRMLTSAAGGVTDTYDYDAHGNLVAGTGTTPNNFMFTGEQFDPALQFYYLRARYMDPAVGAFISQDPYAGNIFSSQSLHKYMYANNDPVNMIDPTGRFSMGGCMCAVSIVGILSSIAVPTYLVYKEVKDIKDKLDVLLNKIPKMKLNEKHTKNDFDWRIRAWKAIWERSLDVNLGGGSVGKAYEISAELVGGTGGKIVAFIWSFAAAEWMAALPQVMDSTSGDMKPAHYLSCGFNKYVQSTYSLQLANGVVTGKMWKSAAMIIGLWLNYFNFLSLLGDTVDDMSSGPPLQPNPPVCR